MKSILVIATIFALTYAVTADQRDIACALFGICDDGGSPSQGRPGGSSSDDGSPFGRGRPSDDENPFGRPSGDDGPPSRGHGRPSGDEESPPRPSGRPSRPRPVGRPARPQRPSGDDSPPRGDDESPLGQGRRPSSPGRRPSQGDDEGTPSEGGPVGCGKQSESHQPHVNAMNRIIGGSEAKPNSWPWLLSFEVDMGGGMGSLCGSNLIRVSDSAEESDVLVTAAHCVTQEETMGTNPQPLSARKITVTGGVHQRDEPGRGQQRSRAAEIRFHPDFRFTPKTGANNDIAIVKLQKPLKFTDTVRPICLPQQGEEIPVDKTCVAAGWGRVAPDTNEVAHALQQVIAPAQSAETCANAWGRSYKQNQMICAGSMQGDSGTCQGDSGGMLACKDGDSWKLYGTTSFGVGGQCIEPGMPGNFARVSSYVDWITNNAKEMTSVK